MAGCFLPGAFPDYPAPVICNADEGEGREQIMMRWGMPSPERHPRSAHPHGCGLFA